MDLTLSKAAKEARVAKTTIANAVKSGRLSAQKLADGSYRIDPAELFRVWPRRTLDPVTLDTNSPTSLTAKTPHVDPHSNVELALLRQEVTFLRDQGERERATAAETIADLRARLDRAEERILRLSDQRPAELMPVPTPRGGWIRRLFGG